MGSRGKVRIRLTVALVASVAGLVVATVPNSASAAGAPCVVGGPGFSSCAGNVTFSSYELSGPYRPVQAVQGTGAQPDVVISFSSPYVRYVRAYANDPDFSNNRAEVFLYGCCWLPITSISGDGTPGVFSVGGGGGLQNGPFTAVRLHSDPSDYVNWHVEYQRVINNTGPWCKVSVQTMNCDGVTATVSPFYQGSPFDPFQASPGTGQQGPVEVTFGVPLAAVQVTAVDPDFGGTRMDAYADDGSYLNTVYFNGDNRPGWTTVDTQSLSDPRGIRRVVLTSAANDYLAFQGITAYPF